MKKRILITGATGFAGSWLADLLAKDSQNELFGTSLTANANKNIYSLDLTRQDSVNNLLKEIKPRQIYNLAAFTSPKESFDKPQEIVSNNVLSLIYLFEAIIKIRIKPKILIISSAEIYHPVNPYAVSKLAQDYLAQQYFKQNSLPVIIVRPHNHTGPRQSPSFVIPYFASQIAAIEKGLQPSLIQVGNLSAVRDFTDVRDMVSAYVLAMNQGLPGQAYDLGSNHGYAMKKLLDLLLSFSSAKIAIVVDKNRFSPVEIPRLICHNKAFTKLTGWQPAIKIEQTLLDTLNYWRQQYEK